MAAVLGLFLGKGYNGYLLSKHAPLKIFTPAAVSIRHRKSINLKNPTPRPLKFRIMQELCKPILAPRLVDPASECNEGRAKKCNETELHDYDKFLLAQVAQIFTGYDLVIAVQRLAISNRENERLKLRLFRKNLALKVYPDRLYLKFIEDNPRYTNMAPLFFGSGAVIAGKIDQLPDLMTVMKKDPYCFVLGGLVGDRLFNRAGLMELVAVPNISVLHGQLSSILNQTASKTCGLLTSHQQQLVNYLQQHAQQIADS